MIATAGERIAKLREAKRMVGARGGAERQRERGAAAQHIQGGSRHGVGWLRHVAASGCKIRSFYGTILHLGFRFAPFMVMRSCALEPRSEMQGTSTPSYTQIDIRIPPYAIP